SLDRGALGGLRREPLVDRVLGQGHEQHGLRCVFGGRARVGRSGVGVQRQSDQRGDQHGTHPRRPRGCPPRLIDICRYADMEELSESFRALGDPTRLRILRLVGEAPLNVSEIVSLVGVAQSSVSHHLSRLRGLELIREERQAGYTYYSLSLPPTDPRWP